MKITRRQIRRIIKESIATEDLLKILRPLKSKEQANYKLFHSMIDYIIAEDTPLGKQLGVTQIKERENDFDFEELEIGPDIIIYFESNEAMSNFANILKSVGLIENVPSVQRQQGHFTAKKQRQTKNPKVYAHMGPRVMFYAVDYDKEIEEDL